MSARADILGRIRAALTDRPQPEPVERDYHGPGEVTVDDPLELFRERLLEYRANVLSCGPDEIATAVAAAVGSSRFVVAADFPDEWRPAGVVVDGPPLSADDLDAVDGVLTTCRLAVAVTGTIVLDHSAGQGRRALTLVPDRHLVIVRAEQVVAAVPDAVAALDPVRPMTALTMISGPSATSDIELNRVEGVHGPRTLDVLLVRA